MTSYSLFWRRIDQRKIYPWQMPYHNLITAYLKIKIYIYAHRAFTKRLLCAYRWFSVHLSFIHINIIFRLKLIQTRSLFVIFFLITSETKCKGNSHVHISFNVRSTFILRLRLRSVCTQRSIVKVVSGDIYIYIYI